MTDQREFVSALPTDVRERLTERSDAAGLLHLAGHLGLILLVGGLIAMGVPGWWLL